jgi:hypothetical protein
MQSTGVLNLVIGLTGVKEKCEAHLSYISIARVLCLFLFSLFTQPPHSSQRRRYISPPPVHAITSTPLVAEPLLIHSHLRADSATAACTSPACRPPVPPARTSVAKRRRATHHPRLHAIHTAAAASMPPSLHTVHAAAAAAPRSPSVRGFA